MSLFSRFDRRTQKLFTFLFSLRVFRDLSWNLVGKFHHRRKEKKTMKIPEGVHGQNPKEKRAIKKIQGFLFHTLLIRLII
jgi:hypothetical protein